MPAVNRSLASRTIWPAILLVIALSFIVVTFALAKGGRAASTAAITPAASCPPRPLANVYASWRLHVVNPCTTAAGIVDYVQHQDDGDYHIVLRVDSPYRSLLDLKNIFGELVLEIVPADQPGCVPGQPPAPPRDGVDAGICTGANISPPEVGRHIAATGAHVLDTEHGWMELHPVWGWRQLDNTRSRWPVAAIARHFIPNE